MNSSMKVSNKTNILGVMLSGTAVVLVSISSPSGMPSGPGHLGQVLGNMETVSVQL